MEECVVGMEGREQKWSRDSKHSQDKNINWNKNNNKKQFHKLGEINKSQFWKSKGFTML